MLGQKKVKNKLNKIIWVAVIFLIAFVIILVAKVGSSSSKHKLASAFEPRLVGENAMI